MELYAGIDLHANNKYLAIIDENDTRVYKRKLPNQPDVILAELEPFVVVLFITPYFFQIKIRQSC